ncbi:centractin- actin- protein of the dynactin complex [Cadophora malorum]|uniref:Centractin- actin- protein of the dynactin complex n=1 Tax=Cadophora malorum TaxID=108018 RepID=A0A8H8BS83_9HELO|nr:centractin- actin- protein of the dynactin complex [Cadophora malorum]
MPTFSFAFDEPKHNYGLWESKKRLSLDDYLDLEALVFKWADSYDAKDWTLLESILAPRLLIDYTGIGKNCWPAMPATEFISMVTNDDFLGDPCIKTQHLLGAHYWERISDTYVIGHHQIRAAHQVYTEPDLKEVKLKGHSHATNIHYYTKVGGVWKFAGLKPTVRWNEHEFEKVFKGSYAQTDEMEMQIPIRERDSGLKNGILVTACELGSIESTVSV